MKAVLISTQPKWCNPIAELIKKIEVRKTRPRSVPFKAFIYCTKDEPLYHSGEKFWCKNAGEFGNGKVIGEFVCYKVDEYTPKEFEWESGNTSLEYHIPTIEGEKTCLEYDEVRKYGGDKPIYFWHISDLVIYDKPKELSDFRLAEYRQGKITRPSKPLTRAPQSWCYVEEVTP